MEIRKLCEFMKNCCRVCLSVENVMLESSNIVENFNKTIDQLMFECANLKITSGSGFPKKLCELCTTELVMIAKFREKCAISANTLDQINRQIHRMSKVVENEIEGDIETGDVGNGNEREPSGSSNNDTFYENIEYAEENVEYVIYDTNAEFIDETDILGGQDSVQCHEGSALNMEEDNANNCSTESMKKKTTPSKNLNTKNKYKHKRNEEKESRIAIKHHCDYCGAAFAQMNNFTRHLQTHNEHDNEQDSIIEKEHLENNIDERTIDVHSSTNLDRQTTTKQKNHGCLYCHRTFPSLSLLATHTRIHTGERPFQCNTCSKAFKTQGALDLHEKRHSGIKSYVCSVCKRAFVESSNLRVHMRTHTGEKPHKCTTCGRSFSRVFLLQIHQRTHTGEKPFGCEICAKSFAQQGDLSAHRRIHSGERPHVCQICHKGFIKSSGLTQHMRRHSKSSSSAITIEPIGENIQLGKFMICYEKDFNKNSK